MALQRNINKYWDYLEQKYPCPKYVGKVKCMEFKDLWYLCNLIPLISYHLHKFMEIMASQYHL